MTDQTTTAATPVRADLAAPDAIAAALGFFRRVWVMRTLSILFVLGLWEWAGRLPVSPTFPTFTQTLDALFGMMADGSLFTAYGETLKPMIVGVGLCGIFGVGLGLAMGLSRRFEWFTLPVWVISQAAPMAAIIPLITFVYGIGLGAKVVAVVIMAAPIVVLNAYTGIRNVNASLLEMGSRLHGDARPAGLQDRPAGGERPDLRGLPPRSGAGADRRRPGRAPDHADRRRRSHHLFPLDRRLSGHVRIGVLDHRLRERRGDAAAKARDPVLPARSAALGLRARR